jgi:hypothetical protein
LEPFIHFFTFFHHPSSSFFFCLKKLLKISMSSLLHLSSEITIASHSIPFVDAESKINKKTINTIRDEELKKRLVAGSVKVAALILNVIAQTFNRISKKTLQRESILHMNSEERREIIRILGAKFWGSTELTRDLLKRARVPSGTKAIHGRSLLKGWRENKEWNIPTAEDLIRTTLSEKGWNLEYDSFVTNFYLFKNGKKKEGKLEEKNEEKFYVRSIHSGKLTSCASIDESLSNTLDFVSLKK